MRRLKRLPVWQRRYDDEAVPGVFSIWSRSLPTRINIPVGALRDLSLGNSYAYLSLTFNKVLFYDQVT